MKFITIPILNNYYKAYFCYGDAAYIKKCLKKTHHIKEDIEVDRDFDIENIRGACFYTDGCHPLIAMPVFPETPEEIGTLAHEATHAINNIFQTIGESTSGEVYSHSVGAIVEEVLRRGK